MAANEEATVAAALVKRTSDVKHLAHDGTVHRDFFVWCPLAPSVKQAPEGLFALCKVLEGSTADVLKLEEIGVSNPQKFDAPSKSVFNSNNEIDPCAYGDIGSIPHQNAACILDFLKKRYMQNTIYTTVEPLLVVVNPFKDLQLSTNEKIQQYRDALDVDKLPPHIFRISRRALDNLHFFKTSQTVIVSGESGAGKTETTKQLMKYFAASKAGTMDSSIQQSIMAANPVLEAFGNAKTVRNNNSSRFGRFMQLDVAKEGGLKNGMIMAFLLEKSRVLTQDKSERSYHVFYQLLYGANSVMKSRLKLLDPKEYSYLNPECLTFQGADDVSNFEAISKSLISMKVNEECIHSIWSVVSGVLLLGNVQTVAKSEGGVPNAASISGKSLSTLQDACDLLFLNSNDVLRELTIKVTMAGKQKIEGRWTVEDSEMLRGSLAKAIYEKTFLWIIDALNSEIKPPSGFTNFMGLLDIFGFEVFKNNSLEQLFINITNEMLQKSFTDVVFEKEYALYKNEGVTDAAITFTTNTSIIQLLTDKGNSILGILEEQCLAPGGSDEKLVSSCLSKLKQNSAFAASKFNATIEFGIVHTIGPITYNATGFLFKNKDVLRPEMIEIVQASNNPMIKSLFQGVTVERGKIAKGSLIGSQFLGQLKSLMDLISSTETHFVRCLKPNEEKKPLCWVQSKVMIQLHALSVIEALQLRQLGFSYRRTFAEFVQQYGFLDITVMQDLKTDKKVLAQRLLEGAKIQQGSFAVGKTMVFLKAEVAKDLVQKQRDVLAQWQPIVCALESILSLKRIQQSKPNQSIAARICAHARRKLVQGA